MPKKEKLVYNPRPSVIKEGYQPSPSAPYKHTDQTGRPVPPDFGNGGNKSKK